MKSDKELLTAKVKEAVKMLEGKLNLSPNEMKLKHDFVIAISITKVKCLCTQ